MSTNILKKFKNLDFFLQICYIEFMNYINTLSKTLKILIQNQYGSINKFSEISGIPYMTISCIIKRGINTATIGTLTKICEALGMTVPELYLKQAYDTIKYYTHHASIEQYPDEALIVHLKESNIYNVDKPFYDDEQLNKTINSLKSKLINL